MSHAVPWVDCPMCLIKPRRRSIRVDLTLQFSHLHAPQSMAVRDLLSEPLWPTTTTNSHHHHNHHNHHRQPRASACSTCN